mgnify:CR=1 FL=1
MQIVVHLFSVSLDSDSAVVVEGNADLKDGSVIKITSTSESGEVKEYKLNIKKELDKNGVKDYNDVKHILKITN